MKKLLWISLCGLLVAGGWAATNLASPSATGPPADSSPTAAELIERLGATLDKLWTSFAVTIENTSTYDSRTFPPVARGVETSEFRYDGARFYQHKTILWEGPLSGANFLTKPIITYDLWDGKAWYNYSYTPGLTHDYPTSGKEGILKLRYSRPPDPYKWRASVNRSITGSFYGVDLDERIDGELRRATNVSVRPRPETVNGSPCYVVNARGGGSEYQVWIDPKHDYNLAKAIIRRNWTSFVRPEHYKASTEGSQVMQLTVLGFQSVDGVWLAKELDWHVENRPLNTRPTAENVRFKITKYARNPDHEALGSFKPTFMREGAWVRFPEKPGTNYVWRQGKAVSEQSKSH